MFEQLSSRTGRTSVTAPSATPPPYATLLSFTRYVARTGPAKATFVGGLRRQRASGHGFNPHGQLIKALKADIAFHTDGTHLTAVRTAVKPRWRPLYQVLTGGALTYLGSLGDTRRIHLAQTRDVLGLIGGLPIKVNPHLGLRYDDGHAEAVRLHLDDAPPTGETLVATLHLMARHMDQILPGADPVVVDVRRGQVHRPDPTVKPQQVEQWLAGEAAAFSAIWATAA
jgi:hypothetical protein